MTLRTKYLRPTARRRKAPLRRLLARTPGARITRIRAIDRTVIPLKDLPPPWDVPTSNELVSYSPARMLTRSLMQVARDLRNALPEEEAPPNFDIELQIDDAPFAMLPWEWAFAERYCCFRSSRFGSYPNDTRSIFNIFARIFLRNSPARVRQFFSFFRRLRVVILRPSVVDQEQLGRGFEIVSRRPLTLIYKTHGIRAIELSALSSDGLRLREALQTHEPHVIHIQAPVSERSGMLTINLQLADDAVTVEYLTEQFKSHSRQTPTVILDPPRPVDQIETARQLLLRNRFAADLIAAGATRAVLGAGLQPSNMLELAAERLAYEMGGLPQFQQLVSVFHRGLSGDQFSTIGAALFVANQRELLC
jgi:hypothetical protein